MITVICENFNTLDIKVKNMQDLYDDLFLPQINFSELKCSCGNTHCLTKHAYYKRTLKTALGSWRIKILRVKCSVCKRTHAVLVDLIVPYSQVLLKQHIEIITTPLHLLENLMIQYNIDESQVHYIKNQYHKHWLHRIHEYKIIMNDTIVATCFQFFKKQFMQIKNTVNIPVFIGD